MSETAGAEQKTDSAHVADLVREAASAELTGLMSMWRAHDPEDWSAFPEVYRAIAQAILRHGEPLLAYDVITEGLASWPEDLRLRQLQGLALARSGATERAKLILEKLQRDGQCDEETLGMLGRTYKDLAVHAGATSVRERFLKRAAETYQQAYAASSGYWSGINAASMNLLIGEVEQAQLLAGKVCEQYLKKIEDSSGDRYWEFAVLGEAALIRRDLSQAAEWYTQAALLGKSRFGDLQSSRRNARLIIEYWNEDPAWIDKYLSIPPVIVFAGHMIDHPDRAVPRFPAEAEGAVAREIDAQIARLKPGFGFASAACGSDILFLESMLETGAEISIVLPYNKEEFIHDSVDFVPGSNWAERFERLLERSARVVIASAQRLQIGGVSYEYCNQLLSGLATIRARQLDTTLIPVAVWDGRPGDGPGGAASVIEKWRATRYHPQIIDLAKICGESREPVAGVYLSRSADMKADLSRRSDAQGNDCRSKADDPLPPLPGFNSRIVAILFADAVGFSKLREAEVPEFVRQFLGSIAGLSGEFADSILAKNTWGDGLYYVFSDIDTAADFALRIADMATKTDWEKRGLPAGLNLRIALHAGPAYEFTDPITGIRTYSGTHVSRAARIEPVTPAGQVYASEAFAALATAQRPRGFTCDYVGQTAMAKGYGTLPAYHVRSRSELGL